MATATIFVTSAGLAHARADAGVLDGAATTVISRVLDAWRHTDAAAIAAQYEPDGDFVSPSGDHAAGQRAIESFYEAAFDHGYAGSTASATVVHVRGLSPTIALIDGSWSIAPSPTSKITTPEAGLFFAVLHQHGGRWWIAALREQTSARMLSEVASISRAPTAKACRRGLS